jgi:subtilisin family serine protease
MKHKYIKNWFESLKYRKESFGIKSYSVNDITSRSPDSENWIAKNGGFDKIKYRGEWERVAVLDTGVDPDHPELKGKVTPYNFISKNKETKSYFDNNSHGTFMIGEIVSDNFGIAPSANCTSYKVLYGDGRDNNLHRFEKDLTLAIQHACLRRCGVISMSFGFPHRSKMVEDALDQAVELGVIPIAAAGNEGMYGSQYPSYPASFKSCISVASAEESGLPAWFSTAGRRPLPLEQPEIAIASKHYHNGILPNNRYGKMTGTSIACPIVAGLALLWRESMRKKGLMPLGKEVIKEFRQWLYTNAVDTNGNGWDNELGYGVLILNSEDSL